MFSNGDEKIKQCETKLSKSQQYNNCVYQATRSKVSAKPYLTRIEKQDTDDEKRHDGIVVTIVLVTFDGCCENSVVVCMTKLLVCVVL